MTREEREGAPTARSARGYTPHPRFISCSVSRGKLQRRLRFPLKVHFKRLRKNRGWHSWLYTSRPPSLSYRPPLSPFIPVKFDLALFFFITYPPSRVLFRCDSFGASLSFGFLLIFMREHTQDVGISSVFFEAQSSVIKIIENIFIRCLKIALLFSFSVHSLSAAL